MHTPVPSLRGHWTLDETSGQRADSSAWANTLTDHNTVGSALGQVGLAADLEADRYEYLSIDDADQDGLDVAGSLTLVGWMRPESLGRYQVMASKYEYAVDDRAYRLDLRYNDNLKFTVSPDGYLIPDYALVVSPSPPLNAGRWYHVAGVFDAAERTLSVYLDGELIGSRSVSYGAVYNASAPFVLGAVLENGWPTQHFDGRLDDWRVYSRALTQEEIEGLMTPSSLSE